MRERRATLVSDNLGCRARRRSGRLRCVERTGIVAGTRDSLRDTQQGKYTRCRRGPPSRLVALSDHILDDKTPTFSGTHAKNDRRAEREATMQHSPACTRRKASPSHHPSTLEMSIKQSVHKPGLIITLFPLRLYRNFIFFLGKFQAVGHVKHIQR
jgi:hypothetical protein